MDVDARGGASQSSATPFPWLFTQSPSTSSTPAAPTQHDPPSVPAPATKPDVQQDDPASGPTQKGVQAGAPPIPRAFCDEILTVLSNLPEEWPLVKIDLILNKAETYYVSWRRFLYLNERLRTLDAFFARRPIGSCNLVLFVHHRLMRGEKSVHDSRIGAEPFVHCET